MKKPATRTVFATVLGMLKTRRKMLVLSDLSDAQLKDIGLTRAEITRAARSAKRI